MQTRPLDYADSQTVARTLRATLNSMAPTLFGVFDGALFDDLASDLAARGISCRSLFLEPNDTEMERAGPWLVVLDNGEALEHACTLAMRRSCGVFWSCPEGEQALWRHLRSINEIMIPDVRFPERDPGAPKKYERVLFRHWDPNVLISVLPQLDADQFVRLFGPAQEILMNSISSGGLTRAMRPDGPPTSSTKPLTIRADQLEAVDLASRAKYCARMSSILRQMAPQETAGMSDAALNEKILLYEASGNRMGLTQERSLGIWGYLMLTSGDRFESQPEIRGYLQSKPGTPDENVETLLDQMVRLASTIKETD